MWATDAGEPPPPHAASNKATRAVPTTPVRRDRACVPPRWSLSAVVPEGAPQSPDGLDRGGRGHVPRAHGTPSAITEPLQGTSVLLQTRNFHATDCWHVVAVMKPGAVQGSPWPVSGAPVPFAVCNSRNCRAVSRRGGPSKSPERGIRYEVPRPENKSAIALKASFGSHSISG